MIREELMLNGIGTLIKRTPEREVSVLLPGKDTANLSHL